MMNANRTLFIAASLACLSVFGCDKPTGNVNDATDSPSDVAIHDDVANGNAQNPSGETDRPAPAGDDAGLTVLKPANDTGDPDQGKADAPPAAPQEVPAIDANAQALRIIPKTKPDPNDQKIPAMSEEQVKEIRKRGEKMLAQIVGDAKKSEQEFSTRMRGDRGGMMKAARNKPKLAGSHAPANIALDGGFFGAAADREMAEEGAPAPGYAAEARYAAMPSAPPPDFNTDEYRTFEQNRVMSVAASPFSTFGADVNTASYGVVRRTVASGRIPDTGVVRTEELVNYFRYDYPSPDPGEPFSVSAEMTDCPWNKDTKLMRVGLATKKLEANDMVPSNFVFLLDVSGSMADPDRLPLLIRALKLVVREMKPQDRISIVTYASAQRLVIEGATRNDSEKIEKALDELFAGGYTNGGRGLEMAYAAAEKYFIKDGNNRIIMGTDGDLNVGMTSEAELKKFVEEKRKLGIYLTVLGFGMGNYKDAKMQALANNGNGNYHNIDSFEEAQKVLVSEASENLFIAAKDVKFQMEFNPAKVKGYRLLGYESRALRPEDFADDTVDSGDVGPGHQVTVMYEIITPDSPYPVPGVDSKYQAKPGAGVPESDEWMTLHVRYKAPASDTSRLLDYPIDARIIRKSMSPDMAFASSVAQIVMIINKSQFKGTSTVDGVLSQLSANPSVKGNALREEFVAMVQKIKAIGG